MSKLTRALTYAFDRNIGWQDRTIRTVLGLAAAAGAVYLYPERPVAVALLAVYAAAQAWTVLSAKCIVCYALGYCTIDRRERSRLSAAGKPFEAS